MTSRLVCYRPLFFLNFCAVFLLSACDKETSEPDVKETVETKAKDLKKEAKELYDDAKPTDCPTFAKELQAACTSIVDNRMNISCNKYLMELETAQEQAGGKLFDAGADNKKVGSALCARGIKRLRTDVAKAQEAGSDDVAWSAKCKDYIATVRKDCLTKIETGTQAKHCQQTIQMLQMAVGQKNDGEMSCSMGALHFKQ